jgi:acyl dehydratase
MATDEVWPGGMPAIGQVGRRSRQVTARDIELFTEISGDRNPLHYKAPVRPGDTITGEVEVTKARADKPITELRTRVVRGDGTVVLEGTAVCYTMPIAR